MKKNLIFLLVLSTVIFSQEKTKVTLTVVSPTLDDTSKIYVAGNIKLLGSWQPNKIILSKTTKDVWSTSIEVVKGTRLEYKFTKGSWATEALGNDSSIPQNTVVVANRDTTVLATILNWRDNFNFKVSGQVTGKVFYHKNFVIDGLKPRDIFVWLPPTYDQQNEKRLPVFYMHDGQNLIDPRNSNTFIDWRVDEVADSLIRSGEVEPFIIVGINNTDDRGSEYSNTPLGKLYEKLIIEKIKPFVDANYRTLTDAKNTAVGGSSMGGLISMMFVWDYPDVFSKAACFSPAFKFSNFNYVKAVQEDKSLKKDLLIYIDNGGIGLETILQPGVDEMTKVLKDKGYVENKDLQIFIDPKAEHNEAAWAKRVWKPIKFFFGKTK
ncbi:MAG: putative hydrolase [Ignavibacteria bacterium]|nr:MAG: putative hydrolase [Ignavibacteria bacterium]KAF0156892.1 MAG: putative hydrolase [Ignavibacteria bacterium]